MSVRTYFVFSKTEKIGISVIFILITFMIILPRVLFMNREKLGVKKDSLLSYLNEQEILHSLDYTYLKDTNSKTVEKTNLNTATQQELENLPCIGSSIAKRIIAYREKVKKFSTTEDIKKVYGLKEDCYQKILPYIFVVSVTEKQEEKEQKNVRKINLNTCDSLQLVQLRGIGDKTAHKILQARNKIRVFHDMKQLYCLGIQAEAIKNLQNQCYIEPDDTSKIERISLNTIDEKKVFKSPGFIYPVAKSFVQYRKLLKKQGKTIASWEELTTNVEGIDKQWLDCWQAYYML